MIDYDKIEGFKALDQKEGKAALAAYALETFDVKLNRQKSLENMLTDLEQATFKPIPDTSSVESVLKEETEVIVQETSPAIAEDVSVVSGITGEVVWEDPLIIASDIPVVVGHTDPNEVGQLTPAVDETDNIVIAPDIPVVVHADESGTTETSTNERVWLEGFAPSIILLGRNASNNGYYTCPWWIYDWIRENPTWHTNPDACPHYSAIQTLKSLVYYILRDGSVKIRESRNSQFITLTI